MGSSINILKFTYLKTHAATVKLVLLHNALLRHYVYALTGDRDAKDYRFTASCNKFCAREGENFVALHNILLNIINLYR